jgi:hypothetical protein
MVTAHLVTKAASDYLALGDGESLRIFERRTEDALGHVQEVDRKLALIDQAQHDLESSETTDRRRLQVLLDFLDRQRHIIKGVLY